MNTQEFISARHGTYIGTKTADLAKLVLDPKYISDNLDDQQLDDTVTVLNEVVTRINQIRADNRARRGHPVYVPTDSEKYIRDTEAKYGNKFRIS